MKATRRQVLTGTASAAVVAGTAKHTRAWTSDDVALVEQLVQAEARENFWAFRKYINPGMIEGWWNWLIAQELQQFYEDYVTGKRPKLVLIAPPQHGKSFSVEDFIAWVGGKLPDAKQIFASYSEDLGIRTNMALQRKIPGQRYQGVFPRTNINHINTVTVASRYQRNSFFLEWVEHKGSFRNTTVGGQVTGQTLDFGFIDDPVKGRKEARSETVRESTWSWLTDDFFSRFSDLAALLMIMTRWHVDDPAGRFLEKFPETRVLRFPAIAERDEYLTEKNRVTHDRSKGVILLRKKGVPLFPEFKSLEFLMERKGLMTQAGWESVYQGNPIIVGGGMFPIENIKAKKLDPTQIKRSVRYWDKAGTPDGGKYTAGCLMHWMHDGTFIVADMVRGQWGALERETRIKRTANEDGFSVEIFVEQEPGSGGKESAENTVRNLAGSRILADKVSKADGDKEIRAEQYAAQVQGGNVYYAFNREGVKWLKPFLEEHETFPNGKFTDQVDATAGAFNKLVAGSTYDSTMKWVMDQDAA